jgi:DNA recombination protein RmuC
MQWTPDTIILTLTISLIVALLGFLVTALILSRKISDLGAQKEKQQALADAKQDTLYSQIEYFTALLEKAESDKQSADQQLKQLNEQLTDKIGKLVGLEASVNEKGHQYQLQKDEFTQHKAKYEKLLADHQQLQNSYTELKTTLASKEQHFKEQMQQLTDAKQSLTKEFENLASKIFEEKGKTFAQTSQTNMDSLLKPFKQQIEGFQKRINEVHESSIRGNSALNAEIKKVLETGIKMSEDASNLTSALKGDAQQRGAWGEAQLKRTLEMSGLIEEDHYSAQDSFKDAEGKHKQTDYLVKLPDGKHIIIDSKVTLNAYDRAVSAASADQYSAAMQEHGKAVRKHIDDLAAKDYTNLIGMHSPNFVLMFMPIEPAYIEVLKHNKELFEYGYGKGVVLVSHTTLIPILRTVSNLWMMERSNSEAREISEKAGEIYNSVCSVAERLHKLGGTLNTASNHYNQTITALAGQKGLYGKIERFNQLSSKVNKSLPKVDHTYMDFEQERLSVIVEPVAEPAEDTELTDKPEDSD